jgi:hypothetical protein
MIINGWQARAHDHSVMGGQKSARGSRREPGGMHLAGCMMYIQCTGTVCMETCVLGQPLSGALAGRVGIPIVSVNIVAQPA